MEAVDLFGLCLILRETEEGLDWNPKSGVSLAFLIFIINCKILQIFKNSAYTTRANDEDQRNAAKSIDRKSTERGALLCRFLN